MKCALGRKTRRTREDDLAIRQSSSFISCDFIYVLLLLFTTNARTKWWYGYLREGRTELLGSRCNSLRSLAMAIEGTDNVVHFWTAFTTLLMNEGRRLWANSIDDEEVEGGRNGNSCGIAGVQFDGGDHTRTTREEEKMYRNICRQRYLYVIYVSVKVKEGEGEFGTYEWMYTGNNVIRHKMIVYFGSMEGTRINSIDGDHLHDICELMCSPGSDSFLPAPGLCSWWMSWESRIVPWPPPVCFPPLSKCCLWFDVGVKDGIG